MQIFRDIDSIKAAIETQKKANKSIGLVPTMGALHEGHSTLIECSMAENDLTVCSIFVNPTQFNNADDLKNYPRTFEKDLKILEKLHCDMLFVPEVDEMYSQRAAISFNFGSLESIMEGAFRPGHFNGVALVVCKLFHIVAPHRAYFGQKDLQQFSIIKRLVSDLYFDIELKCIPTVREEDGLAMSSRNLRLSAQGRTKAAKIFETLQLGSNQLANGEAYSNIKPQLVYSLQNEGLEVEYLELVDADTLIPVENKLSGNSVALCIAVKIDGIRLIDNKVF